MTTPDETVPDTSITDAAGAGLADFAATTEAEWEDSLWGPETDRWGASGLLGYLFDGLTSGKPFVAALIEALLGNAFPSFGDVIGDVQDALASAASWFGGEWNNIDNAQASANYALAQLSAQNRDFYDLFDVADATGLGANWDTTFSGAGSGYIYRDTDGNANWHESGGVTYTELCRYNVGTTSTDYQIVSIVTSTAVQDPLLGDYSYEYALGRIANAGDVDDDCVFARIGSDDLAIGYYSSGTPTVLASTSFTKANGDVWDFHLGTDSGGITNDYEFVLYRNGVEVLSYDDSSSPVTQMGASYRSAGFGMSAGARLLFLGQTSPGAIAVWSVDTPSWGS